MHLEPQDHSDPSMMICPFLPVVHIANPRQVYLLVKVISEILPPSTFSPADPVMDIPIATALDQFPIIRDVPMQGADAEKFRNA